MQLKDKVLHGLKWSVLSKIITQLFSWASTFVVIRLLSPQDYGLMALAMTFVLFGNLFSSGGFITALVKIQEKNTEKASQMFTISLVVNIAIATLLILCAQDISEFYQNTKLTHVLIVMALASITNSFLIVPGAFLDIDMKFKEKAIVDSIAALFSALAAFILAWTGWQFWALVWAYIVLQIVKVVGYHWYAKPRYFITTQFQQSKPLLSFAYSNQLNGLLWFGYNQMDNFLIGKFLGVSTLGIYNVAKDIASLPLMKVASILNQVGFAAFSSLKEDKKSADYYFELSLNYMAIFSFPIFLGISAISEELVFIVLGEKWLNTSIIISILCFVFPFRMMNINIQLFVNALNRPNFNLQNTALMSVVIIVLMLIATQIDLITTAYAWTLGFIGVFFIILMRLKQHFELTAHSLTIWLKPFFISFFMWLVIAAEEEWLFTVSLSVWWQLVIKILTGCLIVIPIYWVLFKPQILKILRKNQ
jgi:O-antigen/teichoic acid export membrane protein